MGKNWPCESQMKNHVRAQPGNLSIHEWCPTTVTIGLIPHNLNVLFYSFSVFLLVWIVPIWLWFYQPWDIRPATCLRRDRNMFRFRGEGLTGQVLKPTRLNLSGVRIYCGWKILPVISVNKGSFSDIEPAATAAAPNCAPLGDSGWKKTEYSSCIVKEHVKGMISISLDSGIFPWVETH